MYLGLISFNYKNTPLEIREKIKFTSKDYCTAYRMLNNSSFFQGTVILSTCNRTELYFNTDSTLDNGDICNTFLAVLDELFSFEESSILKTYAVFKKGSTAVEHLFQLSSGLLSQVIGEGQILAQIKESLQLSLEYQGSDRILNKIFQQAIMTGKDVRHRTGISEKNLSLSSACVNYIDSNFQDLVDKEVLVIGAGEISKIILHLLQERGIRKIFATNRTHGKLVEIADFFENLIVVEYDQIPEIAAGVDIVISSTAAPHYILRTKDFKRYYKGYIREGNLSEYEKTTLKNENSFVQKVEICIFDLAVPRDIDPEIGILTGIQLYNIDTLTEKINKNKEYRLQEIEKAEKIIKKGIKKTEKWLDWQEVVPVIKKMKEINQGIIEEEINTFIYRVDINPEIIEQLLFFAEHLENKLFNRIILNMKNMVEQTKDKELINDFYRLLT